MHWDEIGWELMVLRVKSKNNDIRSCTRIYVYNVRHSTSNLLNRSYLIICWFTGINWPRIRPQHFLGLLVRSLGAGQLECEVMQLGKKNWRTPRRSSGLAPLTPNDYGVWTETPMPHCLQFWPSCNLMSAHCIGCLMVSVRESWKGSLPQVYVCAVTLAKTKVGRTEFPAYFRRNFIEINTVFG